MAENSAVTLELKEDVAVVTINRPEAVNALNNKVLTALQTTLDSIDTATVRCVVVTGAGEKAFIAGADVAEMVDMDRQQAKTFAEFGKKVFLELENFPVPVIAAINGYCFGGGNELAMCCDIRLCSENAVFGQPEVGLGITAGFGGTQRLGRVIGSASKAKEMLFTGKTIKAEEALQIGLVSAVYPQEGLMDAALNLAAQIARNAPIAVRNTKQAFNEGSGKALPEAMDIETKHFMACFETKDQKEGMQAFLERRKDKVFKNR
ncbi:MAG TPA: enoyl-CoA hydratase-related protein [Anaerolineaceae bacterium]|nr:enoyl-CoA hydratase-related protein [Anaerolineaceae bacterium]